MTSTVQGSLVTRAQRVVPGVLRDNRNYRRTFTADMTSSVGTAMSSIAFPLLVLSLGGTALQAGSIATVSLVTRLSLRLPAGSLVDRWDRRRVMIFTDVLRFAVLATIPVVALAGTLRFPHLVAVAIVEGVCTALFGPATTVLTRDVVPGPHLAEALGLGQSVQAASYLVGPAIGGALYGVHPVLPFVADAASYLISALLVMGVTCPPLRRAPGDAAPGGVADGIRWLLSERALFSIMVYASVINLVSAAIDVLAVIVLRAHGQSSGHIGLILSCSGVGAIAGSLLAPRLLRRLSVPTILLGIGVGWALALVAFATYFSAWLFAVLLTALMTLSPAAGVVVGHALLSRTPRPLLGRVSAATSVMLSGLAAVGPLSAGALFQAFGGSGSWWFLAVLTATATVFGWAPLQGSRSLNVTPEDAVALSEPRMR